MIFGIFTGFLSTVIEGNGTEITVMKNTWQCLRNCIYPEQQASHAASEQTSGE
jgi:hypothetical protein